jgi:hypothetical protein
MPKHLTNTGVQSTRMKRVALQLGPSTFGIFDAFTDEAGRQAQLNGPIAQVLGPMREICWRRHRRSNASTCSAPSRREARRKGNADGSIDLGEFKFD